MNNVGANTSCKLPSSALWLSQCSCVVKKILIWAISYNYLSLNLPCVSEFKDLCRDFVIYKKHLLLLMTVLHSQTPHDAVVSVRRTEVRALRLQWVQPLASIHYRFHTQLQHPNILGFSYRLHAGFSSPTSLPPASRLYVLSPLSPPAAVCLIHDPTIVRRSPVGPFSSPRGQTRARKIYYFQRDICTRRWCEANLFPIVHQEMWQALEMVNILLRSKYNRRAYMFVFYYQIPKIFCCRSQQEIRLRSCICDIKLSLFLSITPSRTKKDLC